MKDDRCIDVIITKLGSAYYVFVSTFHFSKEALEATYKPLSLESFCDSLIKERDNLLHFGVISTRGTSNKSFVAQ
jgi:hypothetical protein